MQFQQQTRPYARLNNFHGTKRQMLGHQVQPAWKPNAVPAPSKQSEGSGSKIFLSRLPVDVGEKEVEELFKKTVGPVKECFLIYNSQGNSKGMAIVHFAKIGDAASARAKYNGKIVDGRKPLKIEIITDDVPKAAAVLVPAPQPLSLLQRLGGIAPTAPTPAARGAPTQAPRPFQGKKRQFVPQPKATPAPRPPPPPVPAARRQVKKGPKRLKKRVAKTAAQLDQEMEDYRSASLGEFVLPE